MLIESELLKNGNEKKRPRKKNHVLANRTSNQLANIGSDSFLQTSETTRVMFLKKVNTSLVVDLYVWFLRERG